MILSRIHAQICIGFCFVLFCFVALFLFVVVFFSLGGWENLKCLFVCFVLWEKDRQTDRQRYSLVFQLMLPLFTVMSKLVPRQSSLFLETLRQWSKATWLLPQPPWELTLFEKKGQWTVLFNTGTLSFYCGGRFWLNSIRFYLLCRFQKCQRCHSYLMAVRQVLSSKTNMTGKMGSLFREMSLAFSSLD